VGEGPVTANDGQAELVTPADEVDPYDAFCAAVTLRQLSQWLPLNPSLVLNLSKPLPAAPTSSPDSRINEVVTSAGHEAVVVIRDPLEIELGPYKQPVVVADTRSLGWAREASVDLVLAEGGALSDCLAAEDTFADVARILRPGGRVLASALSLTNGLSRLAEQNRWPELADAPAADVMLVPDTDRPGSFTRCFGPDELRELLTGAGLEVDWIRSRTVLPAAAVRQTLAANPGALGDLVINELNLADAHEGESHGAYLIVSGRKPR
jgi:hypothetical protein